MARTRTIGSRISGDGTVVRLVAKRSTPAPAPPAPDVVTIDEFCAVTERQNDMIAGLSNDIARLTKILEQVVDVLQKGG